jgi:hypothetical protein
LLQLFGNHCGRPVGLIDHLFPNINLLFIFVSIKYGSIGWHPRGSSTTRYHSNLNIKPPLIKMSEAGHTMDGDNHNLSPVEFYSDIELDQMEV